MTLESLFHFLLNNSLRDIITLCCMFHFRKGTAPGMSDPPDTHVSLPDSLGDQHSMHVQQPLNYENNNSDITLFMHAPSSNDDIADDSAGLEYMRKRGGRRRPSQDLLDSRHLLPWQRYTQQHKRYMPVKFSIPERGSAEAANGTSPNANVEYPFMMSSDSDSLSPAPSSLSESDGYERSSAFYTDVARVAGFEQQSEPSGSDESDAILHPVYSRVERPREEKYAERSRPARDIERTQRDRDEFRETRETRDHRGSVDKTSERITALGSFCESYYQRRKSAQTGGQEYAEPGTDVGSSEYMRSKALSRLKGILETGEGKSSE